MCRLEDIQVGKRFIGMFPGEAVEIVAVQWHGTESISVFATNDRGQPLSRILYRNDEDGIELQKEGLPWTFDADGEFVRLASEAYRIDLAHIFDPYLAVHSSSVEPLPHQISAVYGEMLDKMPLRYILADDPGAGKTIMTDLLIKEMIVRGDLKRCLIVSPGSLSEQWQDELMQKFGLDFKLLTNDSVESAASGNVFTEMDRCIARLDKLSRNDSLQEKLKASEWDLIVVDEAHKMSASVFGNKINATKRFKLGQLLGGITRNFLLLTATPHNGKEEDFHLFMSLIDPDRFEHLHKNTNAPVDVSDVMRRLVKEDLLKFDGKPLFPERRAVTVNYDLSSDEKSLYEAVTDYVQEEFNRAENLDKDRKNNVGFALTILQRRLASSPEAIYQSLKRRRERLEKKLNDIINGKNIADESFFYDEYDEDDIPFDEMEEVEEDIADKVTAAKTQAELEAEIQTLKRLERSAHAVRASGKDKKWDELSSLLQNNREMFDPDGQREKLIIFTEHRDTLNYLAAKIRNLFGTENSVVTIHGGMNRDSRREVQAKFTQENDVRVLIATDAAGEGINLQRAHLMVNYDLPWNPNRLEQRFGRIHRIGQREVCHLWNLVSKETREGAVFQRLFDKLEREKAALGGQVFDILGKVTFDNKPLRDLLIEAIRYGNQPEVRERLDRVVDDSINTDNLRELINEKALTDDTMDFSKVMKIREEMERAQARRLQPYMIESFFVRAFDDLGGRIRAREKGRYEISHVPQKIRQQGKAHSVIPITPKYERICFDKAFSDIQGQVHAVPIMPGHPLLDAVIELTREKYGTLLKQGTIFIDPNDDSEMPRLLFYMENSLSDGKRNKIYQNVRFVEIYEDGRSTNAGYAPYLDYRPASGTEKPVIMKYIADLPFLSGDIEKKAVDFAVNNIVSKELAEVQARRQKRLDKIKLQVTNRLTAEINYWDARANELLAQERAGKPNARLNSDNARRNADDLNIRLNNRLAEIEQERHISPELPVITGGALIIPQGLLNKLIPPETAPDTFSQGDRKATEMAAMDEIMRIERELGFEPVDVSAQNVGYDIESKIPAEKQDGTATLRLIEVKGRAKGSTSVTITKNEILTGLNSPNFILAIVEVDENYIPIHTIYLKNCFHQVPAMDTESENKSIDKLINGSTVIYRSE